MLPTPDSDFIQCKLCGAEVSWAAIDPSLLRRRTISAPRQEPAWLLAAKAKEKSNAGGPGDAAGALATVDEVCPKCHHTVAKFYTLQIRSVDEGSTVFYECLKCKNQWNQDN